ncbi:hypothetical protein HRbin10_00183 [bacterium HR10]|nr:hypothetical protein HRbin10_00183 [bacterium HR10]
MSRRSQSQPSPLTKSQTGLMVWLRADYEFPSTFSYRMPDVSAQFAVGSPIPSPATVKLALVDTAIRWSGNVAEGRRIFDLVKALRVCVVPPPRVVRFRAFIKRLKPPHSSAGASAPTVESTGVRDYFLLEGPLSVYIEVPRAHAGKIRELLLRIRRFGTSDSLCWCTGVNEEAPDNRLCPQVLANLTPTQYGLVVRLSDLSASSQFDGFNPFGGTARQANLEKQVYVLPLTVKRSGETWAILERNRT